METPEIENSRFASTMDDPDFHKRIYVDFLEHEVDLIAKSRRDGRKTEAEDFRDEYFYGRGMDKKTCIWPGGRDSWTDDSSGTTWVGVHGNDSICVVTKAGDLDLTRVHGWLIRKTKEKVFRNFRRTVISEIEDLADPSSKLREMRDKRIKTPFGVVSVVPFTDKVLKASSDEYQESKITKFILEDLDREDRGEASSDDDHEIDLDDEDTCIKYLVKLDRRHRRTLPDNPGYDEKKTIKFLQKEMKREELERDSAITINETVQESSDEYDERKAIEFLEEKMRRTVDFTLEGTIQIAISAFQHLFRKNFNAKEIEVCVMDPDYFVSVEEADYKDVYVKHLDTSEIEQHLADMNEPGSAGSSSSGSSSGGSTITFWGSD